MPKLCKIKQLALVLFFMMATACMAINVPGETRAPTDTNVSEIGPGSLNIEVLDYQWTYLYGGTHIRIAGTVVNNSQVAYQAVRLTGVLHDQTGKPVAYGSTYIAPSYLAPGAKGSFEFVALTNNEKGIKHTRLITTSINTQ